MRLPLLTIIRSKVVASDLEMEIFYRLYNISRQGYYQSLRKEERVGKMMLVIKELVNGYRKNKDRRAGSRSLYYNLGIKDLFKIGVTKFERLMSAYGLTLQPLRIRVVTTKSSCQSWNYKNLINGLIVNSINQLVVGDITYVSLGKRRFYLFCLIDVFSLRIVGYCFSSRMRKEEALVALEMLKDLRGYDNLRDCIHHTDGGGQYFSIKYLKALGHLKVSVAGNCLENGLAEQKNGYIKNHLIPTMNLTKEEKLEQEISRIIYFYNRERKQAELGWKSPEEFENELQVTRRTRYIRLHDFENKLASENKRF